MTTIPNYGIYSIAIGIILLIIVPFVLYMGYIIFFKRKINDWTPFLLSIILLILGLKYIIDGIIIHNICASIIAQGTESSYIEALKYAMLYNLFPYPTGSFILYYTSFIFIFFGAYMIKEKYFSKKYDTEEKIQKFQDKQQEVHFLDLEISRKLFHICIISLLIGYLIVGELVGMGVYNATDSLYEHLTPLSFIPYNEIDFNDLVNNYHFDFVLNRWLVVFIILDIGILLILSEFIRFFNYRYYPIKTISGVYRKEEMSSMGPHVHLVFGIAFVATFFPPYIAMAAIAIAGLADAVATIVGVTMGKTKVHKGSNKTWEGCIGGFISAFLFALLSYMILIQPYSDPSLLATYYPFIKPPSILQGIIASFIGAFVFLLIDYASPPLRFSDNLVNPILCGLSMYIVCLIV